MQKLFGLGAKNIVLGVLRKFVFQTEKFGFPNITGVISKNHGLTWGGESGCFYKLKSANTAYLNTGGNVVGFDASLSSSIYNSSDNVQPRSLRLIIATRI